MRMHLIWRADDAERFWKPAASRICL